MAQNRMWNKNGKVMSASVFLCILVLAISCCNNLPWFYWLKVFLLLCSYGVPKSEMGFTRWKPGVGRTSFLLEAPGENQSKITSHFPSFWRLLHSWFIDASPLKSQQHGASPNTLLTLTSASLSICEDLCDFIRQTWIIQNYLFFRCYLESPWQGPLFHGR